MKKKIVAKAKTATKKQTAKPAKKSIAKKPKQEKPEETMDRNALKSVVAQLQAIGSDIKALKSDTDELLQKKVNEALQKLPSGDVLKKLETVDPTKMVTVLKRDCIGVFVDLSDVSCVRCRDNQACITQFLANLKGGMKTLDKAMPEPKKEPTPEPSKKSSKKQAKVTYDPDALVFVMNGENPNPPGDDYHDTFQAILDEVPETMSELRAIVERDFDIDDDAAFVKWLDGLRSGKLIKLVQDLTEENRLELKKAGYDV